jgi:hypothetical protein
MINVEEYKKSSKNPEQIKQYMISMLGIWGYRKLMLKRFLKRLIK